MSEEVEGSRSTATAGRRWAQAALACGLALGLFAARAPVRARAGLDDTYYLLQASSLVEDGDLDLRNDVLASGFSLRSRLEVLTATTPDGSLANSFSIGPSLLWMPAYLGGLPLRRTEAGKEPVRWSAEQRDALHLLSLFTLAGVTFFLLRFHGVLAPGGKMGWLPGVALIVGTPLLVYATTDYTMSHLPSAAATALLLAAALALERLPGRGAAFLTGAALGLVFLVRWQDIVFAAILVPALAGRKTWRAALILLGWLGLGFLPVATLQLQAWHAERGSWLLVPQGSAFFHWTHPAIGSLLFSARSGLLTWSPVFALALGGLLLPWKAAISRRWAFAALFVLAAEVYINAAAGDWWGGHSFGARRMASCVPLLPLGLVNLGTHTPRMAKAALLCCCGWGLFVGHLYWSGIQDLSLVFRGSPSEIGNAANGGNAANDLPDVVQSPGEARSRLLDLSLSPPAVYHLAGADRTAGHLSGAAPSAGGLAATWLILVGILAVGAALMARVAAGRLVAVVLAAYFVAAVGAQVRLATGARRDPAERARWRQVATQWQFHPRRFDAAEFGVAPSNGPRGAALADVYRYLRLFFEWRVGDPAAARRILDGLARRGYPAALEAQASVRAAENGGGSLVRWIPAAFFQAVRGRPGSDVSLPRPACGGKQWEIGFDLAAGDVLPNQVYAIARLLGDGGKVVADLAGGMGSLALTTPRATSEERFGLAAHRAYEVRIAFSLAPPLVGAHLTEGSVASPQLLALPAEGLGAPADLILGRLGSAGAPAPHGAIFSNLAVIAR